MERWSLTGSKYSDLAWKRLVYWETGRCGEVVATTGPTVVLLNKPIKYSK